MLWIVVCGPVRAATLSLYALLAALLLAGDASSAAKRPDLVAERAKLAPVAGAPLGDLTATVRNRGRKPAGRSTVRVFSSADRKLDAADVPLPVRRGVKALRPRARATVVVRLSLPARRFALVCADGLKKVRESNERNNCAAIAVPAPPVPPQVQPPPPGPPGVPGLAPSATAQPTASAAPEPTASATAEASATPSATPSDTTITAGPAETVESTTAVFEFASSAQDAVFECSLDGEVYSACASPHTLTTLLPGAHTFRVRTPGAASPAQRAWTVVVPAVTGGPTDAPAADPAPLAPPLPQTEVANFGDGVQFLWTGADPIQKNVNPSALVSNRVSVLRGRVVNRAGVPVAGVRVSVEDRPELGHSSTRADGGFDLAVQGGGALVLEFAREGFITVQRTLEPGWNVFEPVPDVVLVGYDAAVTEMALGPDAPAQVHASTQTTDGNGARSAAVLVPAGTEATLTHADFSSTQLSEMHVRATEFTVGPTGAAAMPADLPPTTAYTYAVELSVDEAVAAGAHRVTFSKPVGVYVDNFLNMPIGQQVPAGYYDRNSNMWVGADNGVVVKVLSEAGGATTIDVDGDGTAEDAAELEALGIAPAELAQLAALYEPGRELTRLAVTHFTPYDLNHPFAPAMDAVPPQVKLPKPELLPKEQEDDCWTPGSIIVCDTQVLGEQVPVSGTPYSLTYWSDRVAGDARPRSFSIPLTGPTVPATLQKVSGAVYIAGGTGHSFSFDAAPNLSTSLTWTNLRDAYGRALQGAQTLNAVITYRYGLVQYGDVGSLTRAWTRVPGDINTIVGDGRNDRSVTYTTTFVTTVAGPRDFAAGGWDARAQKLGGWSLDTHHSYDPNAATVNLGSGGRLRAPGSIGVAAGTGAKPTSARDGNNGFAYDAKLGRVGDADVAPDGTVFFSSSLSGVNGQIKRLTLDGRMREWSTELTNVPDGRGIDIRRDGKILVADPAKDAILEVQTSLVGGERYAFPVAGHSNVFPPANRTTADGAHQSITTLHDPVDVVETADGSGFYYAEAGRDLVRLVQPDQTVVTVAGGGSPANGIGDGGPAREAKLDHVTGLAIAPNGELVITEAGGPFHSGRVRRVSNSGVITTIAGGGTEIEDGVLATSQAIGEARGAAFAPDGTMYVTTRSPDRVRMVTPDGVIATLAGGGTYDAHARPGQGKVRRPSGITVGPDGTVFFGENPVDDHTDGGRLRAIARAVKAPQNIMVPSRDGREAYEFTREGRHLRTLDGETGLAIRTFGYAPGGLLTSVTEADGRATTIERDGDGDATGIVSPAGKLTALASDSPGNYLTSVTDPTARQTTFEYTGDSGLLTKMTEPGNRVHSFTFDPQGRLTSDTSPTGETQTLEVSELPDDGRRVTHRTEEGRATHYDTFAGPDGDSVARITDPAGGVTESVRRADGSGEFKTPDGTVTTFFTGGDPRWGPLVERVYAGTRKLPSGRELSAHADLLVTPTNRDDPVSFPSVKYTTIVGGKATERTVDRMARTMTIKSPAGRTRTSTYDSLGRTTQVGRGPGLDPLVTTYDGEGRVSSLVQGVQRWDYGYDVHDRQATRTDALNRTKSFTYDDADRITTFTEPGNRLFSLGLDTAGGVNALTLPGGGTHELETDASGRLKAFKPLGALTAETRTYDDDGAIDVIGRIGGRTIDHDYDEAGRPNKITTPESTVTIDHEGATQHARAMTRTPAGGGAENVLELDHDGSLPTALEQKGAAPGRFAFDYDARLELKSSVLTSGPDSDTVAYTRDDDGLVTGLGPFTIARAATGLPSAISDTKLAMTTGYDSMGRQVARGQTVDSVAQYATTAEHDEAGRVDQRSETVGGAASTLVYGYDAVGRLESVTRDGAQVERYTYDAHGNRTSRTIGAGPVETIAYDAQDRVQSRGTTPYTFTADGFLATRGTDTFSYSTSGELLSATVGGTTVTYQYDALTRRVARTAGGQTIRYLYGNPGNPFEVSATRGPDGTLTRWFYDEEGLLFAGRTGGTVFYVATDQVGTPRVVSDASATVIERRDFDSFGNPTADTNPSFELPFGFAGGLADPVTGLVRFGLRDYEPETGRWTARDPALFRGGQENLYGYVGDQPVGLRDPTGLWCIGGSFYSGYGGGGQLCATDEGFSLCAEAGFGAGSDLSVGSGDLAKDGESIVAKVGVGAGPVKAGFGIELDNTGCMKFSPGIGIGPVSIDKNLDAKISAGPVSIDTNGEIGLSQDIDHDGPEGFKSGAGLKTFSAQGKIAGQFCRKALW